MDVHPPAVLSPLHHPRSGPLPLHRSIVQGGIDPTHDAALTDADAHLAADHERHAAEHALLLEARGTRQGRLRSEEHTSELQSRLHLVCRLLLEKKKTT